MACSKNILELDLSPSLPADTDVVMWTLADGTTILRSWATIKAALASAAAMEDLILTCGGGNTSDPAAGATAVTLPSGWAGKRIRVIRNTAWFGGWTRTAGGFTLAAGDAFEEGEQIVIQNY